jgi:hypothetical protein
MARNTMQPKKQEVPKLEAPQPLEAEPQVKVVTFEQAILSQLELVLSNQAEIYNLITQVNARLQEVKKIEN